MRWPMVLILVAAAIQDPSSDTPLARAQARFEEAKAAEKSGGDFDTPGKAAIAAFDEAIKADPKSVIARAGRGEVRAAMAAWCMPRGDFSKRKELEDAVADFDEALKLDPARVESIAGRGFARHKLTVARMFARGKIDELFKAGFEDLDKAIELRSTDPSLFILRGDAYHEKAIYSRYRADPHRSPAEAALADYKTALRLDPACESQLVARIAVAGKLSDSPVAVEDRGPFLVWSKTWELARREATIRRVPIFFYVSGGAG